MSYPTQAEDLTEDWIEKTLLGNVTHLVDAKVVLLQIENENAKSGTLRFVYYLISGVNFINILRTNFSYECCFGSFFYRHVTRETLPKRRSYKFKIRT